MHRGERLRGAQSNTASLKNNSSGGLNGRGAVAWWVRKLAIGCCSGLPRHPLAAMRCLSEELSKSSKRCSETRGRGSPAPPS